MGKRIGTMKCVACGEVVPVKEQDKRPLISVSCNYCGTQVYCRDPEGDAFMRKRVTVKAPPADDKPASTPAPKGDDKPAAKPEPEKKRGSFLDI